MSEFNIKTGKDIVAKELSALRRSVSWASQSSCADIERSIEAYPFIAQARNAAGELIGYLSAFSDGVFTTLVGDLLVHPDYQRRGIGAALLEKVSQHYPGIPVQVHSVSESMPFFTSQGYVSSGKIERVILKNRVLATESAIAWA